MTENPSSSSSSSIGEDLDAKLEAEIEAALGDMSVEDMLDVAEPPQRTTSSIKPQSAPRTGTVTGIHGSDVLIEFGPKSQGVCPLEQFENEPILGEQFEFVIERYDSKEGLLILSRRGALRKAAWDSLEIGQVVEARCTGTNKGGLEMEIAKHRAFMPAGQVDLRHIDDLSVFVGEKFPCEVIELERSRGRIILSRRKPMQIERDRERDELLTTLEVGEKREATITSLQPYGAFADIGGVDGLIHISDISHERIKHPKDVLKQGETVQVEITKIDTSETPPRIGLSMKNCLTDPYHAKLAELKPGDDVSGRVTRIMAYGAFVELAPGVEGLLHISQLSHERVNRVDSVVKVDEIITVKVLDIDARTRRISLSLRALKAKQEEETMRADDPAMRKLRAKFGELGQLKGGIG